MATKNDITLFNAIKGGNHEAFKVFYTENWKEAFSATFRLCGSEEMAQDLVQEAFIRIWEHRSDIDPAFNLKSYLYKTIRNNFLNQIQREKNYQQKIEVISLSSEKEAPDAHAYLTERELSYQVDTVVENMPQGMKQVWQLSRNEYLSIDEISRDLNISPLTVKKQISNALRLLRLRLLPHLEK